MVNRNVFLPCCCDVYDLANIQRLEKRNASKKRRLEKKRVRGARDTLSHFGLGVRLQLFSISAN